MARIDGLREEVGEYTPVSQYMGAVTPQQAMQQALANRPKRKSDTLPAGPYSAREEQLIKAAGKSLSLMWWLGLGIGIVGTLGTTWIYRKVRGK